MEKLTTSLFKLTHKFHRKDNIVDFISALSSARSMLIFMPDKLEHFAIARKFLNQIKIDFPQAKIVIYTRESYQHLLETRYNDGIIFVAPHDINPFGFPKRKLQHKIMAIDFDVIIDLNQDFNLSSTFLCQKSNAALKICLDNQNREPFYNFCFRTSVQTGLEDKYRKLINFLGRCIHPPKTVKS